jgi:hypothetical protein
LCSVVSNEELSEISFNFFSNPKKKNNEATQIKPFHSFTGSWAKYAIMHACPGE